MSAGGLEGGVRCTAVYWIVWCVIAFGCTGVANAADAPGEERLLISPPAGYVVSGQQQDGPQLVTELIPQDQSIDDWRDQLVIQVFAQKPVETPAAFRHAFIMHWRQRCPDAESATVSEGQENGYAFAVWMLACSHGSVASDQEFAWFKAIQGRDAFYLVQRNFAYAPEKSAVRQWMGYLRSIQVCDSRSADRACPLPSE